jgi:hypothetical protein
MKTLVKFAFASVAALTTMSAFADQGGAGLHDAAVMRVRAAIASASDRHGAKAMGNNGYPGTPLANEFRAYPPSCAAWPLPDKATGPTSTARIPLYSRTSLGEIITPETVTITVWRIACSSTGDHTPYNVDGGHNALTLLRIDRDAGNEGHTDHFPTFPALQIKQGTIDYSDDQSYVRSAIEPNTFTSDFLFDTPVFRSMTIVLESYNKDDSYIHLYNNAFTLQINPYANGVNPVEFQIGDYVPTQGTYPDAFAPLPFDGYTAAQWINTTLNEGLLVQITEQLQPNGSTLRQLVFDLLTEDLNGDPLWLVGNTSFGVGATTLTVNTSYLGNGLSQLPWGTATFEIEDCNHLNVTFAANNGLPNPIPGFNGLTVYQRLFSPNGMVCE